MIQYTSAWWLDIILVILIFVLLRKVFPSLMVLFGFVLTQVTFKPFNTTNPIYEWIFEVGGILCILIGGYLVGKGLIRKLKLLNNVIQSHYLKLVPDECCDILPRLKS